MPHESWTTLVLLVIVWLSGGLFTYGATFAYLQGMMGRNAVSRRRRDLLSALLSSLAGPFGPVLAFFTTERFKYGFRFW